MSKPFELWLIWQNVQTRQRYHVGSLTRLENTYAFRYVDNGPRTLSGALEAGYQPHISFPNLDKEYYSTELFPAFKRRLPDSRRPDFAQIIQELGLPTDYTLMDLLKATGGRLATDSYEFVAPVYQENGHFHIEFYVAGWRYYEGDQAYKELQTESDVDLQLEPDNPMDSHAVSVYSISGQKLGYVPAFFSWFLYDVIQLGYDFKARIQRFNPYSKSQLRLLVDVVGDMHMNKFSNHLSTNLPDKEVEIVINQTY